ncbi:CAP domain-containing protein [Saccharothrix sp.]|uniref:CAP domain-containing protein n=1 Tax=Saccharothrix sp. TaxID=1873460 RepID=UPI002811031D|nr:CAP domain-containing protein [Saccharothrix sp.]
MGGLVGLLLGAAGATGVAFASPEQLAPFVAPSSTQAAEGDNRGVGGVGGVGVPVRTGERPVSPRPTTTTAETTTTTTETTTSTTEAPTTTTEPTTQPPATTTTKPAPVSEAQRVVELVNEARAAAGCPALKVDERIVKTAQAHSTDMATRNYFSHDTPEGVDFAERMRAAGYPNPGGENIAQGYRTPEAVMKGWMNSEGHRRNILNCGFTAIGVGLDTRGYYWTQNFGW